MSRALDFQVRKDALREHRFVDLPSTQEIALGDGEVAVHVDVFAFTANNVTYAVFGDVMKYWDFFPAEDGYGRVPVWGFGDVVRSNADGVEVVERLYGYFPMSSYLVMKPVNVSAATLSDGSDHRAHLHPVYNSYQRIGADPAYRVEHEPHQMVLRPLFTTSWLIDDFLADEDFFGAKQVIVTSASSKTSLGLAHALHAARQGEVEVVGLTSPGNVAFCEGLGTYDRVVTYGAIDTLDASVPSVSVDMAGNGSVLAAIHGHFGDALKYSCMVGGTHWEGRGGAGELPGPAPQMFFAPDRIALRMKQWGGADYNARLGEAWLAFVEASGAWMRVEKQHGKDAVEHVYREVLEGRVDPSMGLLLQL